MGTDPAWEMVLLGRVVQIGAGKILGGRAFVETMVGASSRALPRGARARKVLDDVFATHGFRLARADERAA